MKRCSTSLIIREMQVKTTMRYRLILVRMATNEKQEITSTGENIEKKALLVNWCNHSGKKYGDSWKNIIRVLPYDLTVPFLGIYSKKMNTLAGKDICSPLLIAGLVTIVKIWKQTKCLLTNKWIKKMLHTHTQTYTYTHTEILFSHKNEILLFVTTWMDLDGIMWKKSKTNFVWLHLHVESKRKQKAHRYREQIGGC